MIDRIAAVLIIAVSVTFGLWYEGHTHVPPPVKASKD